MSELIDENLRDSSLGEGADLAVDGAVLGVEVNDDVENNQVMDDGYDDRVGPVREAFGKLSPEDLQKLLQELLEDQAGGVADPQNLEVEVNDASEALSAVCLDCGGVTEPDPECKSCKNPLATLVCSRCQNVTPSSILCVLLFVCRRLSLNVLSVSASNESRRRRSQRRFLFARLFGPNGD